MIFYVGSNDWLSRRFLLYIPAWKYENRRMALEGPGKNFSPLYPEVNAIIFDSGYGGLRNTRYLRELVLTHFLQFPKNSHRFPDRNIDQLLSFPVIFHVTFSDNRAESR